MTLQLMLLRKFKIDQSHGSDRRGAGVCQNGLMWRLLPNWNGAFFSAEQRKVVDGERLVPSICSFFAGYPLKGCPLFLLGIGAGIIG